MGDIKGDVSLWGEDAVKGIMEPFVRLLAAADPLSPEGGFDQRPGLQRTPARLWGMYEEFFSLKAPPDLAEVEIDVGEETYHCSQLVVLTGIGFYSLCEHHLLPFFGEAAVGYIPGEKGIVGLSKLARVVKYFSRSLQIQERMTEQIADYLNEGLKPAGLGVVVQARHLCMEMRGVRAPGTQTLTSALRGEVLGEPETRAEFFRLVEMREDVR